MKNRVNDKINKTIEEVKDVNEEDIKEVDEVSEEPNEDIPELTPEEIAELRTLLKGKTEAEAVEIIKESKFKRFVNKFKPTKKRLAILGAITTAVLGGVVAGKLSKGNKEEAPVDYPELPDNDNYNPPREDYVDEKETEDSNIEFAEF